MLNSTYPFSLPPLGFAYDALEPYLDAETMFYHHDRHFAGYINKLNAALEPLPRLHGLTLSELLLRPAMLPAQSRTVILRNGGGVYNHAQYFKMLTPLSETDMLTRGDPALADLVGRTYGSLDGLKDELSAAANSVFGSGWTMLARHPRTGLHIVSVQNQDTLVREGLTELLIFDVWEHAYYLKYKNDRAKYIENLWNIVQFIV